MKEQKTELRIFTIAGWEKEEQYLRKRHREGWRFTELSLPGFYHFEKCTPADVVYQLDYNEEGLKHKAAYVQTFQDRGWNICRISVGSAIFASRFLRCRERSVFSLMMQPS